MSLLNKIGLGLSLILVVTIAIVTLSFYRPPEQTHNDQEAVITVPTILANSTNIAPSPTPAEEPTPILTATPTFDPATEGSFGPKGYFRISAPTSSIYDGSNVTLIITGEAVNQPLAMSYSIDGQECVPFTAVISQEHEWDIFVGQIHASIPLPPLTIGTHSITVYGSLSGSSAQATIHFETK